MKDVVEQEVKKGKGKREKREGKKKIPVRGRREKFFHLKNFAYKINYISRFKFKIFSVQLL